MQKMLVVRLGDLDTNSDCLVSEIQSPFTNFTLTWENFLNSTESIFFGVYENDVVNFLCIQGTFNQRI